jgi:hypothetical protein
MAKAKKNTVSYAINDGTNSAGEPAVPDPLAEAIQSHDFASATIGEAAKAATIPPYKTFVRYTKSTVDEVCGFIHQFLTEHPDLTRKQATFALTQYGINYSTARTQYQKWFSGRPSVALADPLRRDNVPE